MRVSGARPAWFTINGVDLTSRLRSITLDPEGGSLSITMDEGDVRTLGWFPDGDATFAFKMSAGPASAENPMYTGTIRIGG